MTEQREQDPGMGARPEQGDYAGQQQIGGQYGDADQPNGQPEEHQPLGQQQQTGQQVEPQAADEPADTGQAAYGNSGGYEPQPGGQGAGQSSAADAGMSQGQTMDQAPQQFAHSTGAQRSGGQQDGGAGSSNASFEGSSLGGQASDDDAEESSFEGQ